MRFQRNLLTQKFQAEIDSKREQTDSVLGPIRGSINLEYRQARQFHDMVAASLDRIKAISEQQVLLVEKMQLEKELEKQRLQKEEQEKAANRSKDSEESQQLKSPSAAKLTRSMSETLSVSPAPQSSVERFNHMQRPPTTNRTRTSRQRHGS